MEEPRREVERRQEDLEHALRVAADDEHRQHVLADEDEDRHEEHEHPDRLEARAAPVRIAMNVVASEKMIPSSSRAGTNSWIGSSR